MNIRTFLSPILNLYGFAAIVNGFFMFYQWDSGHWWSRPASVAHGAAILALAWAAHRYDRIRKDAEIVSAHRARVAREAAEEGTGDGADTPPR